ncbi:hypothetical protein [Methanococcoides sp. AM1]|uniref:hypothetical protein n=1 Tax=Methanococcoides sp. AM1 TaxID=1201011 RepID=UPI0010837CE9|nr:hypothetical protein [Methanococcoides sp. AM1]
MKSRQDYEQEIIQLHHNIKEYDGTEVVARLKNRLRGQLHGWYDRLNITVFVANNEQTPWTSEELGMKTHPMLLKKDVGHDQVGDYQFLVDGPGRLSERFGGLLVERKGCTRRKDGTITACDLHGTLMSDNRDRFYREIERFERDPRFEKMIIVAECTLEEFLDFLPDRPQMCKFCQSYHKSSKEVGYCPTTETIVKLKGGKECQHYDEKPRTPAQIEGLRNSKRETINSLYVRSGVSVYFTGSREEAARVYSGLVKQWVIGNYDKVIVGLDLPKCEPSTMSEVLA